MYLRQLGLTDNIHKRNKNDPFSQNVNTEPIVEIPPTPKVSTGVPIIASGVKPDSFKESAILMKSIQSLLPQYKTVMYDFGLSTAEQLLVGWFFTIYIYVVVSLQNTCGLFMQKKKALCL